MIRLASVIAAALFHAAGFAAEPAPPRPDAPIYRLDRYTARPGKLDGLHAWFRANANELLAKPAAEPVAFLVPATPTAEHEGRLLVISRYRNEEALRAVAEGLARHPRYKPLDPASTAADALVARVDAVIGVPTDYSPEFTPRRATMPRVFELRSYTSPSPEKLAQLHDRFRDHTLKLFAKHGMENIVYWRPQGGGDSGRQLVYLLGHASQDAAREGFAAFRRDPDWLTAKKASEDKAGGTLTSPDDGVISEFFVATDYSPLR